MPEGEAAETEAGDDAEHPREDDHPPVMDGWLARREFCMRGNITCIMRRSNLRWGIFLQRGGRTPHFVKTVYR